MGTIIHVYTHTYMHTGTYVHEYKIRGNNMYIIYILS